VTSFYTDEVVAKGLEAIERIFGPVVKKSIEASLSKPQTRETAAHLIGEMWTRPQLSVRDRRLLVLGVSATLGDAYTIETLLVGAMLNKELTDEQVDELPLFLSFYAGWGKVRHFNEGIANARAKIDEIRAMQR
jgi:4-carboxymuconolactone decarboxylase